MVESTSDGLGFITGGGGGESGFGGGGEGGELIA